VYWCSVWQAGHRKISLNGIGSTGKVILSKAGTVISPARRMKARHIFVLHWTPRILFIWLTQIFTPQSRTRTRAITPWGREGFFRPYRLCDFPWLRNEDRFWRHYLQPLRGGCKWIGSRFVQRLLSTSGARSQSNGNELGNPDGIGRPQSYLPGILA
jgi:hypothetical protein